MTASKIEWGAGTDGPWIASAPNMFGDHNIQLAIGVETGEDVRAVAAVVSNLRSPDEVAANARAIAEVPAMVRHLRSMRKALDIIDPARPLQYAHDMDLMRRHTDSILARIEGEVPHG